MKFFRLRYNFDFLIKVVGDGQILKINKFGPVLNQLAIEDANHVDNYILTYYESLGGEINSPQEVTGRLKLILWKRQAPFSFFSIKVLNLDSLLKLRLDVETNDNEGEYIIQDSNSSVLYKRVLTDFMFLTSLVGSPETGYRLQLKKNLRKFLSFKGTLPSYSKRKEMLGRKTNFRRKVKKQGLEDL